MAQSEMGGISGFLLVHPGVYRANASRHRIISAAGRIQFCLLLSAREERGAGSERPSALLLIALSRIVPTTTA